MNERIRQLAEQARIKDHWSIDEGRYLINYLNEQKFAELIVRECIRIDVENRDAPPGVAIAKHFGVEQ